MKILSLNVNGLNSPAKRKKIFHFLIKTNCAISCLQETHIKKSEKRLIRNGKLGNAFISANKKKKKGVVLFIKRTIQAKEVINDPLGYYIGVTFAWEGEVILLVGIYGPQENKGRFYEKLHKEIDNIEFDKIILLGDFNGVINTKIDRKSIEQDKTHYGKLPKTFFDPIDSLEIKDVWRHLYKEEESFTYYSNRHHSLSRIDMVWASKTMCHKIQSLIILPRNMSDHNALLLTLKTQLIKYKWRLKDELILNKQLVELMRENIKNYFKENSTNETKITTIWEAGKAVFRGFWINYDTYLKKKIKKEIA